MENSRPIRSLFDLMELTRVDDLRGLSRDQLEAAQHRAGEVITDGLSAIHAIGALLYWANTPEDIPTPDLYVTGVSDALQLLAEAMSAAHHIESTADYILDGGLSRQPSRRVSSAS